MISVKIMRDKKGNSLCYGFVRFSSPKNAITAQRAVNGIRVINKKLKVDFAQPPIPVSERANHNLYVNNLPKDYNDNDLRELFEPFGYVIFARILYHPWTIYGNVYPTCQRQPKGAGLVRFGRESDSRNAANVLNDALIPETNQTLVISRVPLRTSPMLTPQKSVSKEQIGCLMITNLSPDVDNSTLRQLFAQFGFVEWVRIVRWKNTGRSKEYGFVHIPDIDEATMAVSQLNMTMFVGRRICVKWNDRWIQNS